jgi:hypothetical protein
VRAADQQQRPPALGQGVEQSPGIGRRGARRRAESLGDARIVVEAKAAVLAATLLAPLSALAAAPAAAPAPVNASDERCLLTMAVLSGSKDAATARSAQLGLAFFAGRLRGRQPTYDYAVRLKPVAAGLSGQDIRPEIQRCGTLVQSSMDDLDKALGAISPTAGPAKK